MGFTKFIRICGAFVLAMAGTTEMWAQQSRNAWALDAQDGIFRLVNGQWTVMPGLLRRVSVSADGYAGNLIHR